jgi:hypothetical protein
MEQSVRAQEPAHAICVGHLTTLPVSVHNIRWHHVANVEANEAVDREVVVRVDQ